MGMRMHLLLPLDTAVSDLHYQRPQDGDKMPQNNQLQKLTWQTQTHKEMIRVVTIMLMMQL